MGYLEKMYIVSADFGEWTDEKKQFYMDHSLGFNGDISKQPQKETDHIDTNQCPELTGDPQK